MVIPDFISFDRWAASLLVDYPSDDIPLPPPETGWRPWARSVVSRPTFLKASAPQPDWFDGWLPWAQGVWRALNAPVSG